MHRVGRVLSFFSSRRNWDCPNTHRRPVPPPPLLVPGGGAHSLAREGKYNVVLCKYIYLVEQCKRMKKSWHLPIYSFYGGSLKNPRNGEFNALGGEQRKRFYFTVSNCGAGSGIILFRWDLSLSLCLSSYICLSFLLFLSFYLLFQIFYCFRTLAR